MLSKNQIKFIRSLHQSKFREQHGLFLAEGPKVVEELLHSPFRISMVLALESWLNANPLKNNPEIELIAVSEKELERISALVTPNEVLAVVRMPEFTENEPLPEKELILVLDGMRDPGNLGTIVRTADWFGIPRVICSEDCVGIYNPKTVQATMGSIARVKVTYTDLEGLFSQLPAGIPVYGAMLDGEDMYNNELSARGYLLIGSESHGISSHLHPYITNPVSIPAYRKGQRSGPESLNASIAAAILCAEFRRQSK